MKRFVPLLFILLNGLCSFPAIAQLLGPSDYHITSWKHGKKSATVLTYDDWSPGQKSIVPDALIDRELPASIYVTLANIWNPSEYSIMNNAVANGIEIGNHTKTHADLTSPSVNAAKLTLEVSTTTTVLNTNVTGQKVMTFAYPLGAYNNTVIAEVKKSMFAARIVSRAPFNTWNYDFATTEDDYYLLPTVSVGPDYSTTDLETDVEKVMADGGLLTFMIHSIYSEDVDDSWYNAMSDIHHAELLDHLTPYRNQTWITTTADAVRYHKERASSSVTLVANNTISKTIALSDTLSDNTTYNVPLTLRLVKPSSETYSSVTQNGNALDFSYSAAGDSVVFDAVPDGGYIVLAKNIATGTASSTSSTELSLWPQPAQDALYLNSAYEGTAQVTLTNLQGVLIQSVDVSLQPGQPSVLHLENVLPGLYTIRLYNESFSHAQKIVIGR